VHARFDYPYDLRIALLEQFQEGLASINTGYFHQRDSIGLIGFDLLKIVLQPIGKQLHGPHVGWCGQIYPQSHCGIARTRKLAERQKVGPGVSSRRSRLPDGLVDPILAYA